MGPRSCLSITSSHQSLRRRKLGAPSGCQLGSSPLASAFVQVPATLITRHLIPILCPQDRVEIADERQRKGDRDRHLPDQDSILSVPSANGSILRSPAAEEHDDFKPYCQPAKLCQRRNNKTFCPVDPQDFLVASWGPRH